MPAQSDLVLEVQNLLPAVSSVVRAVQSPHQDLLTLVQHGMIALLILRELHSIEACPIIRA